MNTEKSQSSELNVFVVGVLCNVVMKWMSLISHSILSPFFLSIEQIHRHVNDSNVLTSERITFLLQPT